MFDWLFDGISNVTEITLSGFKDIILIAGIILIILAVIKFLLTDKTTRREIAAVFGVVISLVIIVSGIVSATYINSYYSASGGIKGEIGKLLMPNQAEEIIQETSLTIKVDDVVFIKQNDDSYLADISISDELMLDYSKGYSFYINGMESDLKEYSSSHLKGSFTQLFYLDNDLEKTVIKELNYTMFFYGNYVDFDIYLENDIDSVSLWNAYFDKNNCVIDIKENKERNDEYNTISLIIEDELFKTIKVKKNSAYVLPETFEFEDTVYFYNWELDGVIVKKVENITSDLILNLDSTSYYFEQYSDDELLNTLKKHFNLTNCKSISDLVLSLYVRYSGDLYNQNKFNLFEQMDYILKGLESLGEYNFPKYDETLTERNFLILICGYVESISDLDFDSSAELYPVVGEENQESNVENY